MPEIRHQGAALVVLGDFNPAIVQPSWLARYGLVAETADKTAEVQAIVPDAAVYRIDEFEVQALRKRLLVSTTHESHIPLLVDLVVGIMRLLEHTPARFLGMNWDYHYQMESRKAMDAIGHTLAPKHVWMQHLEDPRTQSLTIESARDDPPGYVRVKVEPSSMFERGVYVHYNDHFALNTDTDSPSPAQQVCRFLEERWQDSRDASIMVANSIIDIGAQNGEH